MPSPRAPLSAPLLLPFSQHDLEGGEVILTFQKSTSCFLRSTTRGYGSPPPFFTSQPLSIAVHIEVNMIPFDIVFIMYGKKSEED